MDAASQDICSGNNSLADFRGAIVDGNDVTYLNTRTPPDADSKSWGGIRGNIISGTGCIASCNKVGSANDWRNGNRESGCCGNGPIKHRNGDDGGACSARNSGNRKAICSICSTCC